MQKILTVKIIFLFYFLVVTGLYKAYFAMPENDYIFVKSQGNKYIITLLNYYLDFFSYKFFYE